MKYMGKRRLLLGIFVAVLALRRDSLRGPGPQPSG